MSKVTKIVLLLAVLNGLVLTSMADKGVGKTKRKSNTTTKSISESLSLNLRSGLKYKGTLLNNADAGKQNLFSGSLVTYQKGNTIFIIPYKQKIVVPEISQGYTGVKLIIKTNL